MEEIIIRSLSVEDQEWKEKMLREYWGSTKIVRKGELLELIDNPGFVASLNQQPAGLCTYQLTDNQLEITSLVSWIQGKGVGAALLNAVLSQAKDAKVKRIWLITTNDNMSGLRFYQKNGFRLVALYPNALEKARLLKPEIPLTGLENIPMRDELELEIFL